jgi:hypothetical protein
LELTTRKTAPQYLEDTTANTFDEITRTEPHQKILSSIQKTYTTIGVAKKKEAEEKREKTSRTRPCPTPKEYRKKITAPGFAYPPHTQPRRRQPRKLGSPQHKKTPQNSFHPSRPYFKTPLSSLASSPPKATKTTPLQELQDPKNAAGNQKSPSVNQHPNFSKKK